MKKLFLINGTLGVGKSSTSKELVDLLDHCLHVEGDEFSKFDHFDVHNPDHLEKVITSATRRCLKAFEEGFKIVLLDYVIGKPSELKIIADMLPGDIEMEVITLVSETKSLKERIVERNRSCLEWELTRTEQIIQLQNLHLGDEHFGRQINTSSISPKEAAMEIAEDFFRANVAAFVQNEEGKILFCHRRDETYPISGFQVPQGGVEPGETLEEALSRELEEEIFLTRFDMVSGPTSGLCYLWEKGRRKTHHIGQCQYYFLISVSAGLEEIRPSEDFDFYRWVEPQTLVDEVIDFKKEVYLNALRQLKLL